MPILDFRPKVVDLAGYAGDTMTVAVQVTPPDMVAGQMWSAQVRETPDGPVLATFNITPQGTDTPAYLTLMSADTRHLASVGGLLVNVRKGRSTYSIMRFNGVWDCQVSNAGFDPIRTVVQGTITVDQDVTRDTP